eukprot:g5009.t1
MMGWVRGGGSSLETHVRNPQQATKLLHDDVVSKQLMIDRLIKEADEHAGHIKESGQLIVRLRSDTKAIMQDIEAITNEITKVKTRTSEVRKKALKETFNLTGNAATEKRIKDLIVLIKEERRANQKLIAQIDITQGEIARGITKDDIRQMHALEKAQGVKALFIKKLQHSTKDMAQYRQGVKSNENLILRLEKRLYSNCSRGINANSVRIVGGVSLAKENELREASVFQPTPPLVGRNPPEVEALEHKKDELIIRNKALHLAAGGAENVPDVMGKEAVDPRDGRIKALQEQLVTNATDFGKNISELKIKLMEAEAGGSMQAGMEGEHRDLQKSYDTFVPQL